MSEQIQQLTAELERANEQINLLTAENSDTNAYEKAQLQQAITQYNQATELYQSEYRQCQEAVANFNTAKSNYEQAKANLELLLEPQLENLKQDLWDELWEVLMPQLEQKFQDDKTNLQHTLNELQQTLTSKWSN